MCGGVSCRGFFAWRVVCVDVIFSEKNTLLRSMTQTPMPETPTERDNSCREDITSDHIGDGRLPAINCGRGGGGWYLVPAAVCLGDVGAVLPPPGGLLLLCSISNNPITSLLSCMTDCACDFSRLPTDTVKSRPWRRSRNPGAEALACKKRIEFTDQR